MSRLLIMLDANHLSADKAINVASYNIGAFGSGNGDPLPPITLEGRSGPGYTNPRTTLVVKGHVVDLAEANDLLKLLAERSVRFDNRGPQTIVAIRTCQPPVLGRLLLLPALSGIERSGGSIIHES